jgi:dTDP-4-dehydrorhamnose reductase
MSEGGILENMVKIAIIGSSGLIGSNIAYCLANEGYETIKTSSSDPSLIRLDIIKKEEIKQFLSSYNPEVIVNCAGVVGKEACNKAPEKAVALNSVAAANLAELCSDTKKRLIHLSSIAVFDGKKQEPYAEEDNPSYLTGNWYNITKAWAESVVEQTPRSVIIRVGDTYGYAAQHPERIGGSIFKWAYETLKSGKEVPAFKGTRTNQILLSDIGEAVANLLNIGYEGRLNLGGEEIDIADFFEKMKDSFNLPGTVVPKQPPANYQGNRALNLKKMMELGMSVKNVNEGLESLARHYKVELQ